MHIVLVLIVAFAAVIYVRPYRRKPPEPKWDPERHEVVYPDQDGPLPHQQ